MRQLLCKQKDLKKKTKSLKLKLLFNFKAKDSEFHISEVKCILSQFYLLNVVVKLYTN